MRRARASKEVEGVMSARVEQPREPVVVIGAMGTVHKTLWNRLKDGAPTMDPSVYEDMDGLWGGGKFTGEQVRGLLVQMVSEGVAMQAALAALRQEHPPMPSAYAVERWLMEIPDFKRAMETARRVRGEVLAEAALERSMVISDKADAAVAKVQIASMQWQASKLNADYRDQKSVQIDDRRGLQDLPDEELDRRLRLILGDREVRRLAEEKGFRILEAEVVSALQEEVGDGSVSVAGEGEDSTDGEADGVGIRE